MITEREVDAINRVIAEYRPALEAAGLAPFIDQYEQAIGNDPEEAVAAMEQELADHPIWREYVAACRAQLISEECKQHFARHYRYIERGQVESDEARTVFMLALSTAPDWLKAEVDAMVIARGLVPAPDGYLADGTPMFSLKSVAAHHGLSDEEAAVSFNAFIATQEANGLPGAGMITDDSLVHRMQ